MLSNTKQKLELRETTMLNPNYVGQQEITALSKMLSPGPASEDMNRNKNPRKSYGENRK